MKKLFLLVTFLFLTFISEGCEIISSEYKIMDNVVYYDVGLHNKEIDSIFGADYESFEIINRVFAYDKNHVYYMGKILKEADSKSFQVINLSNKYSYDYYARDNKNVYYRDKKNDGADLSTFKILSDNGYARDNKNIYERGIQNNSSSNKDIDISSLEIIKTYNHFYFKDKNTIYTLIYNNKTGKNEMKQLIGSNSSKYDIKGDYILSNNSVYDIHGNKTQYDYDTFEIIKVQERLISCFYGTIYKIKDKNGEY